MSFKRIALILWVPFLIFPFNLSANSEGEELSKMGRELWLEVGLSKDITKKLTAAFWANSLNQMNPDLNNYDNFLEGSLKYQINSRFSIEGLYRQEYSKEVVGPVVTEWRPQVRGAYSFHVGNWSFRNRHRYEWRFIDQLPMKNRYRTDLRIKAPVKFSNLNFVPYLQEEIFVADEKLKRSRCYLGLMGQLKWLSPSLYLVLQSDRNTPAWDQLMGLGFAMEFSL